MSTIDFDENFFYTPVNYDLFNNYIHTTTHAKIVGDTKKPPELPAEFQSELHYSSTGMSVKKAGSPTKSALKLQEIKVNFEKLENFMDKEGKM